MQKFLNIAEQYVEWLALSIGILYLGLMGWSYVYQPNINVTLGGKVVEPGEIDKVIVDGPIKELDQKVSSTSVVHITPPDVVTAWKNGAEDKAAFVDNLPSNFPSDPNGGMGPVGPIEQNNGPLAFKVLPQVPPTIPVAIASYRTLVEFPDPNFDAVNAPPGAVVPIISKDIDAVSVEAKIDYKALAKAFQDAFGLNGNPKAFQTMYLRVQLWREEQDATGKWGQPTEIPALKINKLPDLPPEPVGQQVGAVYKAWAAANQDLILHPPFYQTANGAPLWLAPDQVAAAAGGPAAGGAPAPVSPVPGAAPGGGRTTSGQPAYAPPPVQYQPPLSQYQPGPRPVAFDPAQGGGFNPLTKVADDTIIAHDDTVQPDKTYRYYVQYRLLNPLFFANRIAIDAVIKQFDLKSPDVAAAQPADMTQAIAIPSRTRIFVKNVQGGAAVHFAVITWNPNPVEREIVAAPGDTLAPSSYMLVDIRQDMSVPSRPWYVLLVDPEGKDSRRDLLKDKADPDLLKWEQEAAAVATPTVGPLTPSPGGPTITGRGIPSIPTPNNNNN
jgi:hypothetical protein